jgi:16S rRNA (uracil1498-N3)-methyltransferase
MSREPRLFCNARLEAGERVMLDETATGHALRVLRLRAGDAVFLFNGDGHDYAGRLVEAGRHGASVAVGAPGPAEAPPALSLHLVLGVSRGQRMDFALQKATELGVTAFTAVFTARSMVRLTGEKLLQRTEHWRRVMISACEQCGRRRVPTFHPAEKLDAWLDGWRGDGILLDPAAPLGLAQLAAPAGGATLLVGPEGGLTPAERARASAGGFQGVRLGPRILRTETAPLAALAAMQALWGDFR